MRKFSKLALLAGVGALLPAMVVCDVPARGSIFGIDYEIRSHGSGGFFDRLLDVFDRPRDCWFWCDDGDGWNLDLDIDFD